MEENRNNVIEELETMKETENVVTYEYNDVLGKGVVIGAAAVGLTCLIAKGYKKASSAIKNWRSKKETAESEMVIGENIACENRETEAK